MKWSTSSALLSCVGVAIAHMEMSWPPPFRSKFNPHANQNTVDFSMTAPLSTSNFPCKGYQVDMGTPFGASVVTWTAGQTYNMTVVGGAPHNGGSCQASLSYDGAKSLTVIHSFIGNCPIMTSGVFPFSVPVDAPSGPAIFSWSWNNKVGNREMYMNCASVTISGTSTGPAPAVPFAARPPIFVANVDNSPCGTLEGADVMYPDPGPDVTDTSSNTAPPTNINGGACPVGSGPAASPSSPTIASKVVANSLSTSTSASFTPVPGGIFVTTPVGSGLSSAPAPTSDPSASASAKPASGAQPLTDILISTATTFSTAPALVASSSRPTDASVPPVPTLSAAAPSASALAASVPSAPPSASGIQSAGTACTDEGLWNCVNGGAAFQRCASGQWSVLISMASGTSCTPGMSANFATRANVRRAVGRGRMRTQI